MLSFPALNICFVSVLRSLLQGASPYRPRKSIKDAHFNYRRRLAISPTLKYFLQGRPGLSDSLMRWLALLHAVHPVEQQKPSCCLLPAAPFPAALPLLFSAPALASSPVQNMQSRGAHCSSPLRFTKFMASPLKKLDLGLIPLGI